MPGVGNDNSPQGDGTGTRGAANRGAMMNYAMDQLRREGVPEEHLRAAAAYLVGQAQMESGLNPNLSHDGGTGFGIYGARDPSPGRGRKTDMLNWLKANGYAPNSAEGQMRYMAKEAMSGRYPQTRRILMGADAGRFGSDVPTITREFESPSVINNRTGAVAGAFANGPAKVAEHLRRQFQEIKTRAEWAEAAGAIDAPYPRGWQMPPHAKTSMKGDDDAAMTSRGFGIGQASSEMLDRARAKGVAGDGGPTVNAPVNVSIEKPGPDTRVKTESPGTGLFREVNLKRSRSMTLASDVA